MYKIVLIGLAGFVGTLARYWISGWADARWTATFPIGTVSVNLIGCFLIGFLFQAIGTKIEVDPIVRSAIFVGFLGGFTTFSSFAVQSFTLLEQGQILLAAGNVLISNIVGVGLVWAGYAISRAL